MKLHKFIFSFLTLLIIFQFCLAQEKPKAALVNEFYVSHHEGYRSIIDSFLLEIISIPNSKGYIIIYGDKTYPLRKYFYEISLKEHIAYRQFPSNRIVFLRGKDEEIFKTQLWNVPTGADEPDFTEADWNYKLPQNLKPFIIHKNSSMVEDGYETFSIGFYSKFLVANPDLPGHLVIYHKSKKGFYKTRKQLLRELIIKNNVPQNQLKFFYLKSKKTDVEFWFVPKSAK